MRCPRCGKMGHLETTCWSRRKIEEPKVNVALEETDEIDTNGPNYEYDSSSEDLHVLMKYGTEQGDNVVAVKFSGNGQPLRKQQKEDGPIAIEGLLNPDPQDRDVMKRDGPVARPWGGA